MFTGEKLTYTEIKSYSELSGANLQPGEVSLIRRLDAIFWSSRHG